MPENFYMPCGCHVWTDIINGEKVFLYEPHSLTCRWYKQVMAEAKRQGKPPEVIDLRENPSDPRT